MMSAMDEILKLESLSIGYNPGKSSEKLLLKPLDLSVRRGEMLALLGSNGIGKSTLLRTIAGLQEKIAGEIRLADRPLGDYYRSELARKISFVFAGTRSAYNMSVYDVVSLGRFPHTNWLGRLGAPDREMVERSIYNVGLEKYSATNIGELSDGEKQRTMIARALAQDTELILLDEPTAFLDLPNRYELVSLLRKLSVERNKSVIFSSHDIHIAIREVDLAWIATEDGIIAGAPEDLALDGSFNMLFPDSDLSFEPDEGVFTRPVHTRMTIKLEGSGLHRYWTERALNRLGIKARPGAVSPSVTIKTDKGHTSWFYESAVVKMRFDDIYSLVLYMKEVLKG